MFGVNIIAEDIPQVAHIIQRAIEEIRQISSQVKVEYTDYNKHLIPTEETLKSFNSESIGIFNTFEEAKKALMSDD